MPKLTKRAVDAAVPAAGGRQSFLWDSEVKGFGLRVTPAGAKSYVLNYRLPNGRERRATIGRHGSPWTCEAARERVVELLRALAGGVDPLDAKAKARAALTVRELCGLYAAEGPAEKPTKKPSSWAAESSHMRRHIKPLLGGRAITSLTPGDIARFQSDVAAGKTATDERTGRPRGRAIVRGGATTAARATTCLATMLQFAVGRGLLERSPAAGVRLLKGERKGRFLSKHEVTAVAEALAIMEADGAISQGMATAIRLLLLTGCRKGEILGLRWAWVDFDRACLRLPDSKTGAKVVQLATPAIAVLSGLARTSSPYVLPSVRGDGHLVGLQRAWSAVRVRATNLVRDRAAEQGQPIGHAPDLAEVRIHDLRHSFASFAIARGAPLFMVGKALGHRQARTTEVYAHLADDPLRAVAERTAATIAAAMEAGTRQNEQVLPAALRRRR